MSVNIPHGVTVLRRGRNDEAGYDWVLFATRIKSGDVTHGVLVACWTDEPDTKVMRLVRWLRRYRRPRFLYRLMRKLGDQLAKSIWNRSSGSNILLRAEDLLLIDHEIGRS